jgi:hypothetical protein
LIVKHTAVTGIALIDWVIGRNMIYCRDVRSDFLLSYFLSLGHFPCLSQSLLFTYCDKGHTCSGWNGSALLPDPVGADQIVAGSQYSEIRSLILEQNDLASYITARRSRQSNWMSIVILLEQLIDSSPAGEEITPPPPLFVCNRNGRAIAQALSYRFSTAAAPVRSRVEFLVHSMSLGHFGFPCQSSFQRLLCPHHLSSGAGTIGQLAADVPSGLSLTPTARHRIPLLVAVHARTIEVDI